MDELVVDELVTGAVQTRTMSSGDVFAELALALARPGIDPSVALIIEGVLRRHRVFFESNQTVTVAV